MKQGILATIGISALAGLAIVTLIIFAVAYASPTKSVKINIDRFGEAHFEMILLVLLAYAGTFSVLSAAASSRRQEKRVKQDVDKDVIVIPLRA